MKSLQLKQITRYDNDMERPKLKNIASEDLLSIETASTWRINNLKFSSKNSKLDQLHKALKTLNDIIDDPKCEITFQFESGFTLEIFIRGLVRLSELRKNKYCAELIKTAFQQLKHNAVRSTTESHQSNDESQSILQISDRSFSSQKQAANYLTWDLVMIGVYKWKFKMQQINKLILDIKYSYLAFFIEIQNVFLQVQSIQLIIQLIKRNFYRLAFQKLICQTKQKIYSIKEFQQSVSQFFIVFQISQEIIIIIICYLSFLGEYQFLNFGNIQSNLLIVLQYFINHLKVMKVQQNNCIYQSQETLLPYYLIQLFTRKQILSKQIGFQSLQLNLPININISVLSDDKILPFNHLFDIIQKVQMRNLKQSFQILHYIKKEQFSEKLSQFLFLLKRQPSYSNHSNIKQDVIQQKFQKIIENNDLKSVHLLDYIQNKMVKRNKSEPYLNYVRGSFLIKKILYQSTFKKIQNYSKKIIAIQEINDVLLLQLCKYFFAIKRKLLRRKKSSSRQILPEIPLIKIEEKQRKYSTLSLPKELEQSVLMKKLNSRSKSNGEEVVIERDIIFAYQRKILIRQHSDLQEAYIKNNPNLVKSSPTTIIYINNNEQNKADSLTKSILSSQRLSSTSSDLENISYIAPYSQLQKQKIKDHLDKLDRRSSMIDVQPFKRRKTIHHPKIRKRRWKTIYFWVALPIFFLLLITPYLFD